MSWTCWAVCSSLALFCTSSRATAELSASCRACSEMRTWIRASSSWPPRASTKIRSAASQNCATARARYSACSGLRRASASPSSSRSAASRSCRIRAKGADHAASGYRSLVSSMSRIASASWFRSF